MPYYVSAPELTLTVPVPAELRYDGDEELRNDASSLPELKMLLRLIGLEEEHGERNRSLHMPIIYSPL
jgi:hypothetical protein